MTTPSPEPTSYHNRFFCQQPGCPHGIPVPDGMMIMKVLSRQSGPLSFYEDYNNPDAFSSISSSARSVTRHRFYLPGGIAGWICSDCLQKMNAPRINFVSNNRSPWVDMVATSIFPTGGGQVIRSAVHEFIPPESTPAPVVEDTEELLHPI